MRLVLDASVALAWLLGDPSPKRANQAIAVLAKLRDGKTKALAPVVWPLEVGNVLARGEAGRQVSEAQSAALLELLAGLPVHVDAHSADRALGATLGLARRYGLSTYDASYLELALRAGAQIATLDDALARAATKAGVKLAIG